MIEVVTVLFKHGYHRAGVAIARSRLDQDCELVREVIASWAGQSGLELCIGCQVLAGKTGGQRQLEGGSLVHERDRQGGRGSVLQTNCIKETSLDNTVVGGPAGQVRLGLDVVQKELHRLLKVGEVQ